MRLFPLRHRFFRRSLHWFRSFAVSLVLINFSSIALAVEPGSVEGRVLNASNNSYLNNARVKVEGTTLETLTDSFGNFRLGSLPPGEVRVTAFYTGLAP